MKEIKSGIGLFGLFGLLLLIFSLQAAETSAVTFNVTHAGPFSATGFTVGNLLQVPDRIYPGDGVQLRFFIQATSSGGGKNVLLHALIPFQTSESDFALGNFQPGDSKSVTLEFTVPNSTKAGSYYVFLYIVTQEGGQAQVGEIPITVNEPLLSNALVARLPSSVDAYAGEAIEVPVELTNVGSLPAQNVIVQMQFSSSNALIPVGADRVFIPLIGASSSFTTRFTVGVNAGANPGYYPITLLISYSVDKVAQPAINQTLGLKTLAKTGLLITADSITATTSTQPSLSISVANVGDTAVRSVSVSLSSNDFTVSGSSEKFLGTLNLDDSTSASFTLIQKTGATARGGFNASVGNAESIGNGASGGSVSVKVSYKDSLNVEHVQQQEIPVGQAFAGTNAASISQRFGRQSQAFTILGLQPLEWIVIIIVLIGAFFAYRWRKRRKKRVGGSKA